VIACEGLRDIDELAPNQSIRESRERRLGIRVVVDDGSLDAAAEGIRPSNAEGPPMWEEGGCTTRDKT